MNCMKNNTGKSANDSIRKIKPSEEKVWLKDFPKGASETPLPKSKVDDYFLETNGDFLTDTGLISTLGMEITWGEVKEEYIKTANSLVCMGVTPGDNIAVSLLNVPQMIYVILACSKLGLTLNMINPLAKPEEVINRIQMKNAKILVTQDKMSPLFEAIKHNLDVEYIITTPIVHGVTNTGQEPLDKNVGWWNDFIDNGKYTKIKTEIVYDDKAPFIYTHSSGSTGPTKPIALGHNTFTHTAHMHKVAEMDFHRGNKWLATIPAIFSTGVNTSVMLPVLLGMTTILECNYDRQVFLNNIKKYMPLVFEFAKYVKNGIIRRCRWSGY